MKKSVKKITSKEFDKRFDKGKDMGHLLADIKKARKELAEGKYYTLEEAFGKPQKKKRKK